MDAALIENGYVRPIYKVRPSGYRNLAKRPFLGCYAGLLLENLTF